MASSATAAPESPGNDRNRAADRDPPTVAADPPPPPPPPPPRQAVYVDQLYRQPEQFHVSRNLAFLFRTLAWGYVALLLISFIIVLLYVLFHLTFPKINVAAANLSVAALTATSVRAECSVTFVLTNPNLHLTTVFDRMEISLIYPSKQVMLSNASQPSIVQPKSSKITFETNLSFDGVNLGIDVAKAMKRDFDGGSITLGVKISATVRYRHGKWKNRTQYMRAYCVGISFAFPSLNRQGLFLNPYQECEVYVYDK